MRQVNFKKLMISRISLFIIPIMLFMSYWVLSGRAAFQQSELNFIGEKAIDWRRHGTSSYSLQYPKNWHAYTNPRMADEIQIYSYDPSAVRLGHFLSPENIKISLFIHDNPHSLSLPEWFQNFQARSERPSIILSQVQYMIGGTSAFRVTARDWMGGTNTGVFLARSGKIYAFVAMPSDSKLMSLFEEILKSLYFK